MVIHVIVGGPGQQDRRSGVDLGRGEANDRLSPADLAHDH